MRSSLILTDGYGRVQEIPLEESEIVIGRDPNCGLCVESDHASWRHAAIRVIDGQRVVIDLGSTNGTTVNGVPATSPILLQSGDRIVLADEIEIEYRLEEDDPAIDGDDSKSPMAFVLAGAVALVLIGISAFFVLNPIQAHDPHLQKAIVLAEAGIDAARGGDQLKARDALREAAGQLYTAGYLDHVPGGDLQREAMRLLQTQLDVSFDLWSFYDNVLRTPTPRRVETTHEKGRCRLETVRSNVLEACLQQWIEHVMAEIRQDTESIPPDFHRSVGRHLRIENEFLRKALVRGKPLVPMLKTELEAAKMPPLLHYIALIESGYRNSATSTAAAAGIWQFMPATGRQYGLRVDGTVDERRDTEKATRAAARYLRDLAFEFGGDALLLALAGYNRGENGVRRSLKKLDDPFSERSYWRLVERDLLPKETQAYVPRFIAAAVAGEGGLPPVAILREAGY